MSCHICGRLSSGQLIKVLHNVSGLPMKHLPWHGEVMHGVGRRSVICVGLGGRTELVGAFPGDPTRKLAFELANRTDFGRVSSRRCQGPFHLCVGANFPGLRLTLGKALAATAATAAASAGMPPMACAMPAMAFLANAQEPYAALLQQMGQAAQAHALEAARLQAMAAQMQGATAATAVQAHAGVMPYFMLNGGCPAA